MRFNRPPSGYHALAIMFFVSFLMACAAPPREVDSSQSSTSSPSAIQPSSTPAAPAVAVGHDSSAPVPAAAPVAPVPASAPVSQGSASGELKWTMPPRWKTGPEKPMRAATYLVPPAAGDSEGAECAVFVNIGGGVNANIKRWIGQFDQPDGSSSEAKAKQNKETINGLSVTTVDLTGTFAGGGMAMGQPAAKKENYRLLGAIVETPQGETFFKLTGPVKTMAAAQGEFQALLKSFKN